MFAVGRVLLLVFCLLHCVYCPELPAFGLAVCYALGVAMLWVACAIDCSVLLGSCVACCLTFVVCWFLFVAGRVLLLAC